MAILKVDFSKEQGPIKRMHEVGQPPFTGGFGILDFSPVNYLKEANITYSRLHDVGGAFGSNRYVDIPNIFRNFDADENDPANYDFAFTDALLAGLAEYDVKPIYRLGVTIENQFHIKAYHIYPPKDFAKWARICEHIIRHYNEGWADGFHYGIEYWEIWNEPENGEPGHNQMWLGTNEQFYELYHTAATHLKKCFGDKIKVGGFAPCTPYWLFFEPEKYGLDLPKMEENARGIHRRDFVRGFFEYIKERGTPLDFFTWHAYLEVAELVECAKFYDSFLKEYGFEGIETHLNEWNGPHKKIQRCNSYASSQAAAAMLAMQNTPTTMLCYYDARYSSSTYAGFFNPLTLQPSCTYYSFVAFGKLYALGTQAECISDTEGLYAVAATNGKKKALMISNISGEDQELVFDGIDLSGAKFSLIDQDHLLSCSPRVEKIQKDRVLLIEWED